MQLRCLVLLVLAGLSCLSLPCSAQLMNSAWPAFRHDSLHTGCSTHQGPSAATLAWSRNVGSGVSSPAIGTDAVYVLAAGNLVVVSFSGEQLWSYPCGTAGRSAPAISALGVIYIASGSWLYAINTDGTLCWKKALPGTSEASPTIGPDGTIYIGCSMSKFQAYRPDGSVKFTYTAGGAISSSAALAADGTIYFGCNDGCLYALRPDGALKWKFTTNPVGAILSSPAVGADGTVHFGCSSGYVFAVSTAGSQKWRYACGVVTSSPAIAPDGGIYFGSQNRSIYALSKVGGLRWKYTTRGPVNSSPAVDANGIVYCGSDDGSVYALNPDGSMLWEYAAAAPVGSSPAIGQDRSLYVLTYDGSLLRLGMDTTPPTTPVVEDDGDFWASASSLHAAWAATDAESGIEGYEYAIGSSPGGQDVVPFTEAGSSSEVTHTGLALAHGARYYFSVRATNGCGLVGQVGTSDGITIDITAPQASLTILSAASSVVHLTITGDDAESGVTHAQYAVLSSPDPSSATWIDCALGSDVAAAGPFDLSQRLYIGARTRNGAGTWSAVVVEDVVLDTTPPTTPVVTDGGVYTSDPTTLHAAWSAQDPESGISSYSYCLGTAPGQADLIPWTDTTATSVTLTGATMSGFTFTSGTTLYFSAKATNGVGLVSAIGSSDGITVDTTPPAEPVVTDGGEWTSSLDTLHATFAAFDPHSGIAEYSYCIGTAPGASDVRDWTSAGPDASVTVSGLALSSELTYYFSARARNGAGLWSAAGTSDGIQYRSQASVWPKFHCDLRNGGKSSVVACSTGHLSWKYQTSGYVESSAAFAGDGTAYIGSGDGRIYAVSPGGLLRWSYQTGGAVDSCPAIGADGEIYVGSCDHYFYCIQPGGTLAWRFATQGMVWSSPCLDADGTVYFGCHDGFFYALRPNGTLKWKYSVGSAVWSSPALGADGTIYFASENGKLYALTPDGTLAWTYQTGTAADSSPTIAEDGTIYFGSGDGFFYAMNPNGTLKWKAYTGNLVDSTAALASDGTVYVGTGGAGTTGTLRAYAPAGVQLWSYPVAGGVRSSPCVDGCGNIFFGSADGKVHALRPDGTLIWSSTCGLAVLSSPAIGPGGRVVVGSDDGGIYCFKDYPADTTPPTTPIVTPAQIFVQPGQPISCSWSAVDPETGIAGYSYAVGSAPGLADLIGWTSVGLSTSMSRSDIILAVGQCCYVSVRASNQVGLTSSGVSDAITCVAGDNSHLIGEAKKRPEGTSVYLPGKVVTAVFADCVFIEEPNRSAGIRCLVGSSDLQVGSLVNALGTVRIENGEKVLSDAHITRLDIGTAGDLSPVCMSGRTMLKPGLDVTGLLVRVFGKVTKAGAYYYVLSDGFPVTSPRGAQGIEIRAGAAVIPAVGTYTAVTGVISRELVNGVPVLVIRAL